MANDSEQGKAEAAYMQGLIQEAEAKANEEQKKLHDVHGSLLVQVKGALVRLDRHEDRKQSGSELPLQDEFAFHLMLAARVYEKIATDLDLETDLQKIEIARQAAMRRVNRYIKRAYREAEKVANEPEGLNLAKFNASLDKARKKLAPMAHTILMEKIIEETGIIFTAKNLENAKKIAEKTPATTQDILYVNKAAGLVTLIKGSEHTAHDRVAGKSKFAHRQMITCRRNEDGTIRAGLNPRIQIRTPSPVVKKGLKEKAIISDVVDKLSEVTEVYDLGHKLSSDKPKAFIYNRYTAIGDKLGDIKGNLQTQSARHILRGAHEYNAKNIKGDNGVFCFVQNISVNGFGKTLSHTSRNPLVRESTLMAEMALMHTLCDGTEFEKLFDNYKEYLTYSPKESYFSETQYGDIARTKIQEIKAQWQNKELAQVTEVGSEDEELVSSVKDSLKKLVAHDLHCTHEYAKLVQTLSVFSEKASIGGCKSGNERAQAINGRVLMLDGMKPSSEIALKLEDLAGAPKDEVRSKAEALNECIHEQYNKEGLYAAASVISLVDQGASAKVEAKPNIVKPFKFLNKFISRNFAEESAEIMKNLKQSKAGAMQAHKGLTKSMKGAWSDHAKSDWSYMSSSSAGVLGAVAATVTVAPAILAVLKNKQKKQQKIEARMQHNERIKELEKFDPENKEIIKGWLKKIGNYKVKVEEDSKGTKKIEKPELHLSGQEKKALYRATHQGTTPKGEREDFIRFLGLKFLAKGALDNAEDKDGQTVKLKDLLGDEGFRLYKKAIKEEGKSRSFRRAVFEKSREHVKGPTWSKRLILWVGGPSSSGKTYSAMNVLKFLKEKQPGLLGANKEKPSGNDVVFADGSFEREISQMRQMVLQCALASGYKGIEDLHKHSEALSVKKYVKETVLASKRFHMVIPETFVRFGAFKEMLSYESLSKQGKFLGLVSEIKAEESKDKDTQVKYDERFRTTVRNMGESRAWRTKPFSASDIKMNNLDIDCESKVYQPKYFKLGRKITKVAKKIYKEFSQDKVTLKVTNDLMYLQKDKQGNWNECKFKDDLSKKKKNEGFVFMPVRAYNAWLKVKEQEPDLVAWYEKNKEDPDLTGSKIEFKYNADNPKYTSLISKGIGFFTQKTGGADVAPEQDSSNKKVPPAS
ncbi:MAG: hypothetical protein P1U36_08860 [Legionellaceae bacterium]|nr:hypothetical protein [Legionellaceae bacterium]